jgi:hypothetical protein
MASQEVKVNASLGPSMKAIRSLIEKKGWTIRAYNPEEGSITARTPASILSWGEDVVIHIKAGNGGSVIGIDSNPAAQLFDWGRSKVNVAELASEIGELKVAE